MSGESPNFFGRIVRKLFGSRNERLVRKMMIRVAEINALEQSYEQLRDEDLRAKTDEFRDRLEKGETLDDLLTEAFAVVREAGKRSLGMRHFDVQMVGGMVLHSGKIAEMRTGEGKTLVATLAAYLNALPGKGVHVVTVNDYLARRDAEWMGAIYELLGLSVGVIVPGMQAGSEERRAAYSADITYGTNNEFGFDYLRDNMAFAPEDRVQREPFFAVVDEVDSILIDEARTPLIISGPTDDRSDLYVAINKLIPSLQKQEGEEPESGEPGDYYLDEKGRQVHLTEQGHEHIESLLSKAGLIEPEDSLYSPANIVLMHHVNAALRAHSLFQKDVDYVVNDGEIVIVDEFTGRTMPGRRWSEGLHQAIEAKESVAIQNENQTLASITFQNYFRLYSKLSGMTGTADTEAFEFQQIYGLEVVVIPTHRDMVREDHADLVYMTRAEKFTAIIEDIRDCAERGQPVLVGTTSIETSEYLHGLLSKEKIEHQVLNAKFHEKEAFIIAQAGRPGSVTVATNMAGRGTDIVLGGNLDAEIRDLGDDVSQSKIDDVKTEWQKRHEEVLAAGGLHIIGTERHESRRIDNQLRGRSGRQGDPGSSRFYLSLEDPLMRRFASDKVAALMQRLGMEEGEYIQHSMVTNAIERAQRKVEGYNFDIRKQLLEYDDVANDQRKVVYQQRNELMNAEDVAENIQGIRHDIVYETIDEYIPQGTLEEQWDVKGLEEAIESSFGERLDIRHWLDTDHSLDHDSLREKILGELVRVYEVKEQQAGAPILRQFEKSVMLQVLDSHWKEHLAAMDHLRQGIGLRGYAQKNPKQEYKREAFEMFQQFLSGVAREVLTVLSRVQVREEKDVEAVEEQRKQQGQVSYQHAAPQAATADEQSPDAGAQAQGQGSAQPERTPYVRKNRKVGRNEPCPCGSGKKYKQCHGKLQ